MNGSPYLVLERVDGETLAHRLARGPLPLEEALAIAVQIVAGLEEAHAKGVIHRDLKPSNVMLAPGRQVKLVDFGLAKTAAVERDAEESIEPITEIGLVVGTARYMSPEQVTGGDVDTRTDVWAFGCVLYEMLTGRPVFGGRSVSEVAAALLRDEPDWSALRPDVPRAVTRLIRRCLRRDPRARLQHIGDARIELVDLEQDAESQAPARRAAARAPAAPVADRHRARHGRAGGRAICCGRVSAPSAPSARLSLELPAPLTFGNEFSAPFALAPDGSRLAVEVTEGGTRRLYCASCAIPRCVAWLGPKAPGSRSSRPTGNGWRSSRTASWPRWRSPAGPCSKWRTSAATRAARRGPTDGIDGRRGQPDRRAAARPGSRRPRPFR